MLLRHPAVGVSAALLAAGPARAQPIPPEFQVNSIITGTQGSPVIATTSGGSFATAFTSAHVPGRAMMYRLFDPPTAPATVDLMAGPGDSAFHTAIAAGDSCFVVAWDRVVAGDTVKIHVFDHAGVPLDTVHAIPDASTPALAMHSSGSFVVIYQRPDSSGASVTDLFGQRFSKTGGPVGLEFPVNLYTTSYQQSPSVAMAADGHFVVAWHSDGQDGSWFGVYARLFDEYADPVTGELLVNTYTMLDQTNPDVAVKPNGEFAVVWEDFSLDGSAKGVYGQYFDDTGTKIGSEFPVNQYAIDQQNDPACTFDGPGNLIVSWTSDGQDGDVTGVYCRRFGLLGQPLGDEVQVNVQTILYQFDSDVAADAEGNFVVVWQSFYGDGDSQGCFGRRFAAGTLTSASRSVRPLALSQNAPNPFNPATTIRYTLPAAGAVDLGVFDVRGRRVATLVSGTRLAGLNRAAWDGRDSAGNAASSGVYFCRLRADGRSLTRKMVLLK
jgi:hypothetical protein